MSSLCSPSSLATASAVKKKKAAKARIVFGEAVVDGGDRDDHRQSDVVVVVEEEEERGASSSSLSSGLVDTSSLSYSVSTTTTAPAPTSASNRDDDDDDDGNKWELSFSSSAAAATSDGDGGAVAVSKLVLTTNRADGSSTSSSRTRSRSSGNSDRQQLETPGGVVTRRPRRQGPGSSCTGPFDKIIGASGAVPDHDDDDDDLSSVGAKENDCFVNASLPMPSQNSNNSGSSSPRHVDSTDDTRQRQQHLREQSGAARLPQQQQQRRDLARQTQRAVDKASVSVNESLNKARQAKEESFRYRSLQTAKIKQEWEEERAAAEAFHREAENNRRKLLHMQRDLSSKFSKQRARQNLNRKHRAIDSIDEESRFKSRVYRDHQQTLRQQEENRRRMSVAARQRLRANKRTGEERLRLQRIDEDQAIFEERHEASAALRQANTDAAENRRKSFAFRNGDAKRIRDLHAAMEAERLAKEQSSYEMKWEGERDAAAYKSRLESERRESLARRGLAHRDQREGERLRVDEELAAEHEGFELDWSAERDARAYRQQLEKERRESLAFRNSEGLRQRKEEAERASDELADRQRGFELKLAGEKDADEYLKKMEKERRDSLHFRNQEGKRIRDLEAQQRSELLGASVQSYALEFAAQRDAEAYRAMMEEERRASLLARNMHARDQRHHADAEAEKLRAEEHSSYEMKWAGEKDAEQYRKKLEQERRESLRFRNEERFNHAKVMEELQVIAREKETESLVLKWAGENDAKEYMRSLEEARRRSFQQRGQEILHRRQVESDQYDEELRRAQEDEQWRSEAQKDVEAYKEECAARDRASLLYRRKEAHIQRLEEEERLQEQRELDGSNFQLESMARTDVEEYLSGCRERRRHSLAFRAKEKRRHKEWRREQEELARESRSRDVRSRLMDMRYAQLAQHEERQKHAMEAIRHAGCSFNPFTGVL